MIPEPAALLHVDRRIIPVLIEESQDLRVDIYSFHTWTTRGPTRWCGPTTHANPKTVSEAAEVIRRHWRGGFAHVRYAIVLRGPAS